MHNPTKVNIDYLIEVMNDLRLKCPWDRKQTLQSLRPLTIEELYELVDAIDLQDWNNLKEELGDILLHIVFYSKIAEENNQFTFQDVVDAIVKKLIERHPHIYGDVIVENEEDVKKNWEKIKQSQHQQSILKGVPKSLPAVTKAFRIQEKVKQVGFEWKTVEDVYSKIQEEMEELSREVLAKNQQQIEEEFGDVLFSLINYARFLNVDPEAALEKTNQKFIKRFMQLEEQVKNANKDIANLSLEELDAIWNDVKKQF